MKRRAIIQYASDDNYADMLMVTNKLHSNYCAKHSIDFIIDRGISMRLPVWWRKVELLRNNLPHYDQVAWVDADCVIVADGFNIFEATGYGVAVCESRDNPQLGWHLQCGVVFCTNSPEVNDFLNVWLNYPMEGIPKPHWGDNAAFIQLMERVPYRDLLTILPCRFNHMADYMKAREPIYIEAFHGLPNRIPRIQAVVERVCSV